MGETDSILRIINLSVFYRSTISDEHADRIDDSIDRPQTLPPTWSSTPQTCLPPPHHHTRATPHQNPPPPQAHPSPSEPNKNNENHPQHSPSSPALLSLNREARHEALQSYHLIRDLEGERGFYYNPHLDTIHLTSSTKYSSSSSSSSASEASSTSTPQDEWLLSLSQITSSLPSSLGVYSLALRGVSTLPPSSTFLSSGGSKVREMLMLVGPGAHRRGTSTYCGVSVGFMRKMMCREMERALEVMDEAGGFESGRCPTLVPLVGGSEDEVEERVLE